MIEASMDGQGTSLVFVQYLSTVFDNISDGILLITVGAPASFRLTMANKPFHEFSGYPTDAIGKELSEFVSPDSYAFLLRQFKKVLKTKKPVQYMRWAETPSGMRAFDGRLIPIIGTTGDVVQIAAIIHDNTEQEQLRQEAEHLRATVRGIRSSIV